MGQYTDWFLAEESEAERVASIAGEDDQEEELVDVGASFDDWPHLEIKALIETDLTALWRQLAGGSLSGTPVRHPLYVSEDEDGGGVLVACVAPAFIEALAAAREADLSCAAQRWHATALSDNGWAPEEAGQVLSEMTTFALEALREGKPVLELSSW